MLSQRKQFEIKSLLENPPLGTSCRLKGDTQNVIQTSIVGVQGTPYEYGVFELEIILPDRYPFEPPRVHFLTPIYHPNIDGSGRICLDLLKTPPNGTWSPVITLQGILTAIQFLMGQPNPNDPLMPDIAKEYKFNKEMYETKAKQWTKEKTQNNSLILTANMKSQKRALSQNNVSNTEKRKSSENMENTSKKNKYSSNADKTSTNENAVK